MQGLPIPEDDRIESRLAFDWALMPTQRWAQIDTTETTAGNWYGMWTNPFQRRILIYAEGDISDTVYADDAQRARFRDGQRHDWGSAEPWWKAPRPWSSRRHRS